MLAPTEIKIILHNITLENLENIKKKLKDLKNKKIKIKTCIPRFHTEDDLNLSRSNTL